MENETASTSPPLLVPRLLWGGEGSGSLYKVPFHTFGTAKRRFLRLKPYESHHIDGGQTSPSWVDVALVEDFTEDFANQTQHRIVKASCPLAFIWNDQKLSSAAPSSPLKKLAAAATFRDSNNSNDRELLLGDIIQFIGGKRTVAFRAYIAKNGTWSIPHESQCFSLVTVQRTFDFFVRKNDAGGNSEDDTKLATLWKDSIQMLLDNVRRWERNGLVVPQQTQRMISFPMTRPQWDSNSHRGAIFEAARSRDIGTLRWYFENGCPVDIMDAASGDTVLIIACRLGHLDVARFALIDYHAKNDPHPDFGQTALQVAVSAGHKRIVQLLLETMESSYADRIVTNHVDENGEAPIHVAARCGSSEIMELLILHGANLGLVDGLGKTCLHCASQSGHASCLALALDSGADEYLEVLTHDGFTPLLFAVRSNKTECVKLLLESGADVSAETASGQNVWGLASKQRNDKILALLDQYDDLSDEDSCYSHSDGEKNIFHSWKRCAISPTNPMYTPSNAGGLVSPEKLTPSHPNTKNEIASFARRAPLHSAFAISPIVGTNFQVPYDGPYPYTAQQPHHSIFESPHRGPDDRCSDHYPSDGGQFNHGNEAWMIYFADDGYPYFYNINRNWSTWNDPRTLSEPKANIPRETPLLHMNQNGTRTASDESRQSTRIPPFTHILTPTATRTPTSPAVPLNLITKIAVENQVHASERTRATVVGELISTIIPSTDPLGDPFPSSAELVDADLENEPRQQINNRNKGAGDEIAIGISKLIAFRSPSISSNSIINKEEGADLDQMASLSMGANDNSGEPSRIVASSVLATALASNVGDLKDSGSTIDDVNDADPKSMFLAQIKSRSARGGVVVQASQSSAISTDRAANDLKDSGSAIDDLKDTDPKGMLLAQIKLRSASAGGVVEALQSSALSTEGAVNPKNMLLAQIKSRCLETERSRSAIDPGDENSADPKGMLLAHIEPRSKGMHEADQEQSSELASKLSMNEASTTPSCQTTVDSCLRDLSGTSAEKEQPTEDPAMAKYIKMKSVGIPMEAILHKMTQDGFEAEKVNTFQSSDATARTSDLRSKVNETAPTMRSPKRQAKEQLKDTLMQDEDLKKFMRMASVGVPAQAVLQKMKQEGVDNSKIGLFSEFHGMASSINALPPPIMNGQSSADHNPKAIETSSPKKRSKDQLKSILMQDETVKKFMRMASVGVPAQAVAQKMHQEGVDQTKIDLFNEFHDVTCGNNNSSLPLLQKGHAPASKIDKYANITKEDLAKDDTFSKYLKMKDVGIPTAAVTTKMAQDGIDNEKIHMFSVVFGLKASSSSLSPKLSPKKLSPKLPMLRERRRASKALQKIHWTAVAEEKLQNSLWASESIEIDDSDIERFESLFSASPTEKGGVGQKASITRKNSINTKSSSVIDPKRANNIAIALAHFRAFPTFDDLCQAVASLDGANLNIEQLANLQLLLPTPEESNMLKGFDGQSDDLGRAEQFFLSVTKVPRFSQKLAAFKFSLQFDEQVHSLTSSLHLLAKACTEVVESKKLAGILRRLLAIGNLMNESCGKPHARGITLDSLIKTAIKKGSDGKTTVIDLLVTTAMSNNLDIVDFWSDTPTVRDAMRFDLDDFRLVLREIQNGAQSVDRTIGAEKTQVASQVGCSTEQFLTQLIPFLERAKGDLDKVKTLFSSVEEKVQLLCCFFAEESKTCKASTIFGVLIEFSRLIEKSKERHLRKEKSLKKRESTTVKP